MRLIDGDAFDEVLQNAQTECKKNGGNFRYGVLSNVRANLAKMPSVGGWISVKDRLPKKYIDVLALVKYDGGERYNSCYEQVIAWLDTDDGDWDSDYDDFNQSEGEVTHWMPLPEPPKQEDVR